MEEHILGSVYSFPYKEKCKKCGIEKTVYTQKDDHSEFITQVGILCICGEMVWFDLPVN